MPGIPTEVSKMNHGKNHLITMGVGLLALLVISKFVGISAYLLFFFFCFFMMATMMLGMDHGNDDKHQHKH